VNGRWLAAVIATAALVWFNSPALQWAARLWTTLLLAALPALMLVQAQQLRDLEVLPRQAAYISSIISLWLLAAVTLIVSSIAGIPFTALGFAATPLTPFLLWTGALTAAGVGMVLIFHASGFRDSELVRQLIPVTGTDRALFLGVSITAGVCEEIVFRGFLLHVLLLATGSLPLALLLSSGVFGVVHAYQQPLGALRAALLGAMLALPLLLTGSIYPAIVAHILIDVLSGFWLSRHLLR
jgi:uncharacterized protein